MNFTLDLRYPVLLLVLWALGVSMIALAALIHLPFCLPAVVSGTALFGGFVVLRALNLYSDPVPSSVQRSTAITVLSFFKTMKYPPSLAFLRTTLGPALLALAYLEHCEVHGGHPLVVLARVPLLYYVTHFCRKVQGTTV